MLGNLSLCSRSPSRSCARGRRGRAPWRVLERKCKCEYARRSVARYGPNLLPIWTSTPTLSPPTTIWRHTKDNTHTHTHSIEVWVCEAVSHYLVGGAYHHISYMHGNTAGKPISGGLRPWRTALRTGCGRCCATGAKAGRRSPYLGCASDVARGRSTPYAGESGWARSSHTMKSNMGCRLWYVGKNMGSIGNGLSFFRTQ